MDVPAPEIKVVLDPDYTAALRESVMTTITNAVADARQQTGIDSPWCAGKKHIAAWLDISPSSLDKLIAQGMPIHYLGDVDRFTANKFEVSEWIKKL